MSHKQILLRPAAREKILRGAGQLADAVRVILGGRHGGAIAGSLRARWQV